jgi:hypothetical protein
LGYNAIKKELWTRLREAGMTYLVGNLTASQPNGTWVFHLCTGIKVEKGEAYWESGRFGEIDGNGKCVQCSYKINEEERFVIKMFRFNHPKDDRAPI